MPEVSPHNLANVIRISLGKNILEYEIVFDVCAMERNRCTEESSQKHSQSIYFQMLCCDAVSEKKYVMG